MCWDVGEEGHRGQGEQPGLPSALVLFIHPFPKGARLLIPQMLS